MVHIFLLFKISCNFTLYARHCGYNVENLYHANLYPHLIYGGFKTDPVKAWIQALLGWLKSSTYPRALGLLLWWCDLLDVSTECLRSYRLHSGWFQTAIFHRL